MIDGGFYLKARCIQDSEIAHAPPYVREIWDWLIKEANHRDKKYNGFIVKRGQLFRTYRDIREGLHWMVGYRKEMYNENQTKKAMRFLRKARMIDTSKELGGVLITILNYDKYQNPTNYERTNESTNGRTNAKPMKNHPLPVNNKNEKNVKNDNKTTYTSDFEKFWREYPKRIGKGAAYNSWLKIKPNNGTFELIISAVSKQRGCAQWKKDGGQYIPNPSTWLNQRRWQDDIEVEIEPDKPKIMTDEDIRKLNA